MDTESSAQAGTISGVQIRELELAGRNFQQLVTLQPGVVSQMGDETSAGNTAMSVNGARTSANNWTIDGADINDSGSNGTVINAPNVDAIQEFTLQRGNYDAGYGRSGGGQVLVATKAGTSTFHGDAYEFVRNTALDANEWFNKRTEAENGDAQQERHQPSQCLRLYHRRPGLYSQGLQHRQEQDLLLLFGGMAQDQRLPAATPCRLLPRPC